MYFAEGLTVRERFAKSLTGADYMSSHIVCVGGGGGCEQTCQNLGKLGYMVIPKHPY